MDLTPAFQGINPALPKRDFASEAIDLLGEVMAIAIIRFGQYSWIAMKWMAINGFLLTRYTMIRVHTFMRSQVTLCGYEVLALAFIGAAAFMKIIQN